MQISGLSASSSFADSDVLAIEVNNVTYKVTGETLKNAVLAKLGASPTDPVTVAHGGTGATDVGGAKVNLGLQSAGQAVNISQPTDSEQVLALLANVNNENSSLNGKRVMLLLQDSALRLYNVTDSQNKWQLNIPVTVAQGGTGVTVAPSVRVDLSTEDADGIYKASPRPGVTGTLPVAHGGTGATAARAACANLGAFYSGNLTGVTDADNTSLVGVAFLDGGACSNLPSSTSGSFFFCLFFGTIQIVFPYYPTGMSRMYARGYANNQWYEWKSTDFINKITT